MKKSTRNLLFANLEAIPALDISVCPQVKPSGTPIPILFSTNGAATFRPSTEKQHSGPHSGTRSITSTAYHLYVLIKNIQAI